MDFIERMFNISPDAGTGATEVLFLMVGLIAAAGWAVWRIRSRRLNPRRWTGRRHIALPVKLANDPNTRDRREEPNRLLSSLLKNG